MIVGNLGQESSLEGICALFYQEDIEITKQGLDPYHPSVFARGSEI